MAIRTRVILRQVHLWVGLVLGLFLAVLGLSGSLLVYEDFLTRLIWPPPAATGRGAPLPLDTIASIAAGVGGRRQMEIDLPSRAGEAVVVRVGRMSPMVGPPKRATMASMPAMQGMAGMAGIPMSTEPPGVELFLDPASGEVLATRDALEPPLLVFAHQLHGNLFMGAVGRTVVGWLGVAITAMGLSGLVLWWPRPGRWRRAFSIKWHAAPRRIYRDLHAVVGAVSFALLIAISISGVLLAFPQSPTHAEPLRTASAAASPVAKLADLDQAVRLAERALPGGRPRAVIEPSRVALPIVVDFDDGGLLAVVSVDPRSNQITIRRPIAADGRPAFVDWQRPFHRGAMLGPVWKAIVFLTGLLPAVLMISGAAAWLQRPRAGTPARAHHRLVGAAADDGSPLAENEGAAESGSSRPGGVRVGDFRPE